MCSSLSIKPAKNERSMLQRIAAMIGGMILLRELLQVGLPALTTCMYPAINTNSARGIERGLYF